MTTAATAVLLLVASAVAQEEARTLRLLHADSTRLVTTDAGINSYSYGNVLFAIGKDRLACDIASWLRSEGRIICTGDVKLTQPHRWLTTDSLVYDRHTRTAWAFGNAVLVDSLERVRIEGARMTFFRDEDRAICDSLPRLIMDFDDTTTSTIITSSTLEFDRDSGRGWAVSDVEIEREDWTARCGRAVTWPDSGMMILTENPVAIGSNAESKGDTIILYSINRNVEKVSVIGDAEIVFRPAADSVTTDSLAGEEHKIWGDRVDFLLEADQLERINAYGAAKAHYFPGESVPREGELRGENQTSGDTLSIFIEDNSVNRAEIHGGARGTYYHPVSAVSNIIDTIEYASSNIILRPGSSEIDLHGNGQVSYQAIQLTADNITYHAEEKRLFAKGTPDPDSADAFINPPILMDGTQTVYGETLTYNLETERGKITGSFTEHEKAYYRSQRFLKYTEKQFFVEHGTYTTCEYDEPHYHFYGKTMKVIRGDKVISRPVVLYIDKLPLFIIPYYIFPIKPGRHSGFTQLRIGNFERGQRFVENIGYYWAASEYWDLEVAIDIREATGLQFRGRIGYALRYVLDGYVDFKYAPESRWVTVEGIKVRQSTRRWRLLARHNHELSPSMRIAGSANFISDETFYTDYSFDQGDRLNRQLRSQVNFSKRWSGASITVAAEHVDDLDTDEQTLRSPNANFTLISRNIFPRPEDEDEVRWYHGIKYSYSNRLNHAVFKRAGGDKQYATLHHRFSLIPGSHSLLTYINITPSISGTETWYYVFDTDEAQEEGVLVEEPARRGSFSLGASANTKLYGFLHPRIFGVESIRHVMTPRVSYSLSPAITAHQELRSFTGVGGGSSTRSQILSFSLGHNLDAKYLQGGEEQKSSLLTGDVSASYNLEATERKWSKLNSSLSTRLANQIQFNIRATHDLYNPRTLELQWLNPRLENFSVSSSYAIRGGESAFIPSRVSDRPDTLSPTGLPFNASFSYRYSETRFISGGTSKAHTIGGTLEISPTANWRVDYKWYYDVVDHRMASQTFTIYRDLHCWEAQFNWVPGGNREGYYFRVNVKQLPDIKFEKSESGIRGAFR